MTSSLLLRVPLVIGMKAVHKYVLTMLFIVHVAEQSGSGGQRRQEAKVLVDSVGSDLHPMKHLFRQMNALSGSDAPLS